MTSHSLRLSERSFSFRFRSLAGLADSAPTRSAPEVVGNAGAGRGLGLEGGARRLRAGKGAARSAVRAIHRRQPAGLQASRGHAPSPPVAVTRETGPDRLPTQSWFHGILEESSFGALGGSSGPGHQLDAPFW